MADLTQARLREVLNYDPETGVFRRLVALGRRPVGEVGGDNGGGYKKIGIDRHRYYAHRLAWLYVHGEWPTHQIDHINMDRADNRIVNLREATSTQNKANIRRRSDNTSGFKGVYWHEKTKKWIAKIVVRGKQCTFGHHSTPEAASNAYAEAARKHFGEFSRSE